MTVWCSILAITVFLIHEDHEYKWLSNSKKFSKAQVIPLIRDDLPSVHATNNLNNVASKAASRIKQDAHNTKPHLLLDSARSYQADAPLDAAASAAGRVTRRSKFLLGIFIVVVVVSCVAGPVVHYRNQRAAAAAAVAAERNRLVLPLPPMVPLTKVFYDGFSYLSINTWTYTIGNGIDRGDAFWGFGNGELQCYTTDSDNVDIISPNPATDNLRLQARYHPVAITCADRWPFNTTKTHWTSGRINSKSQQIFLPPTTSFPGNNNTGTNSCTSLFIEARMKFPAVQGSRAALLLLPEPQNQTINGSTTDLPPCRWIDECGKYGRWPASGEIDIVSHTDQHPDVVHAIQIQEYGKHRWRATATGLGAVTGWHTYKLEWHCNYLRWFVDGVKTFEVPRQSLQSWRFDQPFFLVFEYSIGGRLVDPQVDLANSFMLVDYIRVWPANRQPPVKNTIILDGAEPDDNMTQVNLTAPPVTALSLAANDAANLSSNALYATAAALESLAGKLNSTITTQQARMALNVSEQSANSSRSSGEFSNSTEDTVGDSSSPQSSDHNLQDSSNITSLTTQDSNSNFASSSSISAGDGGAHHNEQSVNSPATPSSSSTEHTDSGTSSLSSGNIGSDSSSSPSSGSSSSNADSVLSLPSDSSSSPSSGSSSRVNSTAP